MYLVVDGFIARNIKMLMEFAYHAYLLDGICKFHFLSKLIIVIVYLYIMTRENPQLVRLCTFLSMDKGSKESNLKRVTNNYPLIHHVSTSCDVSACLNVF